MADQGGHGGDRASSGREIPVSAHVEASILDTLSLPLLVLDQDEHRVVQANRALYELFQTKSEDVVDRPLTEIVEGALDNAKIVELLAAVHPNDGARVTEALVPITKTVIGRRVFLVNARQMQRRDLVLLSFEDVTERLDAGEKLERRALLLESMSDAVIAGDVTFQIQEWNPAAERLFGWTASEVRGRRVEEILTVVNIDRQKTRDNVRSGKTVRSQMRVQNRAGKWIDIEFSTMPVKHAGVVTGFVSVMQDVSERIRLEHEAEKRMSDIEAANKELESFSYTVSHDLRAPVRAIDGFSRLLEEDYGTKLDDEGRRLLGVIRKSANRMGELIDDLLAFSQLGRQEIAKTNVDMHALARDAFEEARRLEANREFQFELGPLPPVLADRGLVMQVWQNLITNAVKYSRGRAPAVIRVDAETHAHEIVYHVRDNGAGFDMRYAHKLFGVFERLHTNSQFEGTGVGLALVERVVTRHGGRVWAEAEIDVGATFHFALPRRSPDVTENTSS